MKASASKVAQKRLDALTAMAKRFDRGELGPRPSLDELAAVSKTSSRTLFRQYGSLAALLRAMHEVRWQRAPLPPLELLTRGVARARGPKGFHRLIDQAAAEVLSARSAQARRVRAHVLAAALHDPELAKRIATLLDDEHASLERALQQAQLRGLIVQPHDRRDLARLLMVLSFGHLSFDLFPARSAWTNIAAMERLMWHLLLRGASPEGGAPPAAVSTDEAVAAVAPPALPDDERAQQLLAAACGAIDEQGEEQVSLRDLLATTGLEAHACYRWFGDTQGLLDAAHAELLVRLEEPDAERFSLRGRMTRVKLAQHIQQAVADVFGPHRRDFRQRRLARLGVTWGRPGLEGVASFANARMAQRLIALYQRWNDEADLGIDPIGNSYGAIALSEGFGYLDFAGEARPGPGLQGVVEWLCVHLARLTPEHQRVVAPYHDPTYVHHQEELAELLAEAEQPTLPTAPRRRSQVNADQILLRAAQILHDEGIGALNLAELARRSGITTANLMYYYPTRDLLLGSLASYLLEAQEERWRDLLEAAPAGAGDSAARWVTATLSLAAAPEEASSARHLSLLAASFAAVAASRQQQHEAFIDAQIEHFRSLDEPIDTTAWRTVFTLLRTLAEGAANQHADRLEPSELRRGLIEPAVALVAPALQALFDGRSAPLDPSAYRSSPSGRRRDPA